MTKFKVLVISLLCILLTACNSTSFNNKNIDELSFEKDKNIFLKRVTYQDKLDSSLSFGLVSEPENLNPFYYNDESSKIIINTIFDPLFKIDQTNNNYNLKLLNDLIVSEDNTNYTLTLKDNIFWHDGVKLDIDDVIFTINFAIENKETRYLDSFYIDGVPISLNKVDDLTLNITLPRPSNSFVFDLSKLIVVPQHIYSNDVSNTISLKDSKYLIGNSSYMFEKKSIDKYFNTEELNFKKYDNFYGEMALVDNLNYKIVAHYDTPRYDLLDYNIQGGYIPGYDTTAFEGELYNTKKLNEGQVASFLFKTNSKFGGNVKVRNTLSNIISPAALLGNFGDNTNVSVANSVFSSDNQFRVNTSFVNSNSVSSSLEYLNNLQLSDPDFILRYGFILDAGGIQEKIAIYLQELFIGYGINFELVPLYENEYLEMLNNPDDKSVDFCLYIYDSEMNPQFYKNYFEENGNLNFSGYNNPELDKLWKSADESVDYSEQLKIYHKIQEELYKDKPIFPILYLNKILIVDDRVQNIDLAKPNSSSFFDNLNLLSIKEFNYDKKMLDKYKLTEKDIDRTPQYDHLNIKK